MFTRHGRQGFWFENYGFENLQLIAGRYGNGGALEGWSYEEVLHVCLEGYSAIVVENFLVELAIGHGEKLTEEEGRTLGFFVGEELGVELEVLVYFDDSLLRLSGERTSKGLISASENLLYDVVDPCD